LRTFGIQELEKTASNARDSGWFFGCTQRDHAHNDIAELQRKSLYEAAVCIDSRLIPFLALPPESRFV